MKKLDTYLVTTFLQLLFTTLTLLTFIMLLFDVFSNLERYLQGEFTFINILVPTLMFIPEAISFTLPPAALFASTYMLSMMYANNEMIILSNSGFSFFRIILPLVITAFILTLLFFGFNETFTRKFKVERNTYVETLLSPTTPSYTNGIILSDEEGRYILYAKRFNEDTKTLSNLTLFLFDEGGALSERVDAASAQYSVNGWNARKVQSYRIGSDQVLSLHQEDSSELSYLDLTPQVIGQRSVDINTMDLNDAYAYIQSLKRVHNQAFTGYAVDFYQRLTMNLAPLILIMISCTTVIPWKKNVLVLSIITSISIAVIYYVLTLSGTILARQELVEPQTALLFSPVILFTGAAATLIIRRK